MRPLFFWLLAITQLPASLAHAGLGQPVASIESDRATLAGVRAPSTEQGVYTVEEVRNEGLRIREYVYAGSVVGLAWRGMSHPDLRVWLGAFYSDFAAASRRAVKIRGRRKQSLVRGSRIVVKKMGHLRWAVGSACVSDLLPAGGSCDDFR